MLVGFFYCSVSFWGLKLSRIENSQRWDVESYPIWDGFNRIHFCSKGDSDLGGFGCTLGKMMIKYI